MLTAYPERDLYLLMLSRYVLLCLTSLGHSGCFDC